MIHLVYESNIFLNIETAIAIRVYPELKQLGILYERYAFNIDITKHTKVKEFLEKYEGDKDEMIKRILFEVLELIVERLSKTDEKMSAIFYLDSVLTTIVYKLSQK